MNEFDALQLAIDLATKHGAHNQKKHGNRVGGGGPVMIAGARVKLGTARTSRSGNAASGGAAALPTPKDLRGMSYEDQKAELLKRYSESPAAAKYDYELVQYHKKADLLVRKASSLSKEVKESLSPEKQKRIDELAKRVVHEKSYTTTAAPKGNIQPSKQLQSLDRLKEMPEPVGKYGLSTDFYNIGTVLDGRANYRKYLEAARELDALIRDLPEPTFSGDGPSIPTKGDW
jgi:hypothetical protein